LDTRLNEFSRSVDARIHLLNARIDELSHAMDARLNDLRDVLRAEMAKNQSEMLMKFAELDSRLTRIESHLSLK
jgi:hypothetical protein